MSGERILILDDSPKQLDLLGKYLGKYGYKTLLCAQLTEALATISERDDIRIIMCASSGTAQTLQANYETLFEHAPELPIFLFAPQDFATAMLPEHHEHIALPLELPALVQRIKNTLRALRYSGRKNLKQKAEEIPQQNGTHSFSEHPQSKRGRRMISQQPSRRHPAPRRELAALPVQAETPVAVEADLAPAETPTSLASETIQKKPTTTTAQLKQETKPTRTTKPKQKRERAADTEGTTLIASSPAKVPDKVATEEPTTVLPPAKKTRGRRKAAAAPSDVGAIFPKTSLPLAPTLLETVSKKATSAGNKQRLIETFSFPTVKLTLDRQKEELRIEGETVALSTTEYILMKYLLENRNRVLSREEILNDSRALNPETSPRNVDAAIRKLRRKIGDDTREQPLIQTVWGVGYLLQDKSKRKPHS